MGMYHGSTLMIGEMFTREEDGPLDFDSFEESGLGFDGDMISNSYVCVGVILDSTDMYNPSYKAIVEIGEYPFIEKKITEKLQFLFPNRELNVQMYLLDTIS